MADAQELEVNAPQHAQVGKTKSIEMMQNHVVSESSMEPLIFAKFIVKCPFLLCGIIIIVLFIVIAIDSQFFALSEQSDRTFFVEGNKYIDSYDAYTLAGQFIADNDDNSSVLPQTQTDEFWLYQHMFTLANYKNDFDIDNAEKTDYWILTPENIETIIKYENMIVQDDEWKNRFCYAGEDPISTNYSCNPGIHSVARMLYNDANFSSMTTDDIKDWVAKRADEYASFFNPGLAETGQTFIYRSLFFAGLPIATEWETVNGSIIHETIYRNPLDKRGEQETEYIDWATTIFKDITVDNNGDLIDGNLQITTTSFVVYSAYFNVILNESMIWLIFAIMIVLIYMSIHLGSIFLAVSALIQILMSFPLAYFFYRIVFQIPHYDTLSSLIIFVLLGVGADDVFVFTDAWLQSAHFVKPGLPAVPEEDTGSKCCKCCINPKEEENILRMSFTFRRAAKAMLVTQMTTIFAFMATATSLIMPIAAFGIWAATVVAMNYVLVISMYPAVLIIHHRFIKKFETAILCCLCNLCHKIGQVSFSYSSDAGNMRPTVSRQLSQQEVPPQEYRCFEQFLGRKWSKCIIKCKVIILLFFIALFALATYGAAQMEAQSEQERWFDDEHYMQKSLDLTNEFSASESDNLVQILITFGIDGVDRDGSSKWDPEEYGNILWDSSFDISSPEAQSYLLAVCEETKNSSSVYAPHLVTCPIEDFREYLESIGLTFPYQETLGNNISFGSIYNDYMSSSYGSDARSNALTYIEKDDDEEYVVRFYAMHIYTTLAYIAPGDISRDERSKWNNYINDITMQCPDGLCNSVRNVALRWCWLETETAFITSAMQGILIAMPLAFVVLLLSTQNWIVSIFAVLDIIGIMLCELSIMHLQGWKLGVSECVAIVIIIGFSVDYVVHLANSYLESEAIDRESRLSFSLLTMGISVISGAITTFAAGFFLIFPDIIFFYKMGVLMMTTVGLSIFWAMCFFTSIIALCGPQGNTGDIKKYFNKCCPCNSCKDNKQNDNDGNGGDGRAAAGRTEIYSSNVNIQME